MNLAFLVVLTSLACSPTVFARVGDRRRACANSTGVDVIEGQYIVEMYPRVSNITAAAKNLIKPFGNAKLGRTYRTLFKGFVVSGSDKMIDSLENNPLVKSINLVRGRILCGVSDIVATI